MRKILRRFKKLETSRGTHVPTRNYEKFSGLINTLDSFYFDQIFRDKPEYIHLRSIICSLTEIVGLHCEAVILQLGESKFGMKFISNVKAGNESFYNTYEWMFKDKLITEAEFNILQKLKTVRNAFVHLNESTSDSDILEIKKYATSIGLLELIVLLKKIIIKIDSIYNTGQNIKSQFLPRYFDEILSLHGLSLHE